MREIKFRAYKKSENRIIDWEELKVLKYKHSNIATILVDVLDKIYMEAVMQYTGLKDKNGKEIYEGDILAYWEDNIGYVAFDYGSFRLKDRDESKGSGMGMQFGMNETFVGGDCKIIGNIHENPELLKKEAENDTE